MHAQLTIVRGNEADQKFALDPGTECSIGRGADCQIPLTDPLASRVHAIVLWQDGQWLVKDCNSRNGTLVNGAKIDEAALNNGCRIRIGKTEIRFADFSIRDLPTEESIQLTQTLVQDAPVGGSNGSSGPNSALSALQDRRRRQDLLDLYQLSFRLLSVECINTVAELGLDVLTARTKANVVGLLWADPAGQLRPQLVFPPQREGEIRLNQKLTDMVCRDAKAIWVKNEKLHGNLKHIADAICVPMVQDGKTVGAIHIYRENEKFEEPDFEFAISAANLLSASLIRAQQQAELQSSCDRLVAKNADFHEMLGESPPMLQLKQKIQRVALADGCVLIRGESGSGKELVARALHRASLRNQRPLLCVNCAAIPAELMESQLFGHRKGAFTGADKDHAGWFQQADTGTLFLDEVGELTLEGQAKLLRVLEGHPFLPVGSNREIRVDVRLLAATNRDLKELVREKRFREDLFYRLGVFELWIPPLRERGEDIDRLIDSFLTHFKKQRGRQKLELHPTARDRMREYAWPGNVRQLRNVIDSAVVMATGEQILPTDLGLHDVQADPFDSLKIEDWERRLIKEAMKRSKFSIPDAAELLGISRATLYRKLEAYGIDRERA